MNLKCMINGKVSGVFLPSYYDNNRLVQGNTIAEDYSETLDSGAIVLTDVPRINDLDPYDDVYIWDSDFLPNFTGISKSIDSDGFVTNDYSIFVDANNVKHFYKHFLLDRFTEERNLLNQNNYTYKIELFSETKGLENIVCPNIKITQPLNVDKRLTTLQHMAQYLELYSPKIKVEDSPTSDSWHYEQKYRLSTEMKEMFADHYCQEFSLNSPTLRELFTKLMVSKDSIPVVKDNVIYPLCLSKTRGEFQISPENKSFIIAQKTSDGYMTEFRTNYNNALSSSATCHRVEQLGFRNSDEAIMTINNMRLETSFPIYKLNRVYMCYYKKVDVDFLIDNIYKEMDVYFLCKQDITKLCVLNNERQSLYKDTRVASNKTDIVDFMKDNYYFTVGYSIGSNLITGFGEMFKYIEKGLGLTLINKQECIIRNILNNMDRLYPYGIEGQISIRNKIIDRVGYEPINMDFTHRVAEGYPVHDDGNSGNIPSIFLDDELSKTLNSVHDFLDDVADATGGPLKEVTKVSNAILIAAAKGVADLIAGDSNAIKGLTFEVDYEGFFNGAVTTQKDISKNQITKNDNQSESMPYLDLDGIARERKIQKMGNKSYTISARYEKWEDVQDIGTTLTLYRSEENLDDDEEIIIYHREISLYDNKIEVTYFGQESFVLKNFYTSVFAKQRLFNVLDYGSSLTRAENVKDILYLSKNKWYDISPNFNYTSSNISNLTITDYLNFEKTQDESRLIDTALINFSNKEIAYLTDINTFTYGNSICFNMKMVDNITMGTKIDPLHLCGKVWGNLTYDDDKNFRGTSQDLCAIYDEYDTGRVEEISFYLAKGEKEEDMYYNKIVSGNNFTSDTINCNYQTVMTTIAKDGKTTTEIADMLDISPISISFNDYTMNRANYNIAKWQVKRLFYPLVPFDANIPATIKNAYTKTFYKDANEIIDMTLQNQLLIDKKDRNDVIFSDLALKISDLVGVRKKNDITTIPRTITFIPFQYIRELGNMQNNKKVSLQGFAIKIPEIVFDNPNNIIGKSLNLILTANISSDNKTDRYEGVSGQGNRIKNWQISINNLYFVDEEKIRVNCNFIRTKYLDISGVEQTIEYNNAYFYLNWLSPVYVDDIDKNDYRYFSNIMFDPADVNIADKFFPMLSNYWIRHYDSDNTTWTYNYLYYDAYTTTPSIILSPNDANGVNTTFYGYTAATYTPSPVLDAQILNTFMIPKGDYYGGYIYNYYNKNLDGQYRIGKTIGGVIEDKELMTINYQEHTSVSTNYYVTGLDVFKTLNTNTQCYLQWDIFDALDMDDFTFRDRIVCVGGKDFIETSITDKKVKEFDASFGDILKINDEPILCQNIIEIHEYNGQMGYMDIRLDRVPNLSEYNSIQEWIFNASVGAYEFVCGFNISAAEKDEDYIRIYLSLIGNMDLQVYNNKGILVGKVANKKPQNNSTTPNSANITR